MSLSSLYQNVMVQPFGSKLQWLSTLSTSFGGGGVICGVFFCTCDKKGEQSQFSLLDRKRKKKVYGIRMTSLKKIFHQKEM